MPRDAVAEGREAEPGAAAIGGVLPAVALQQAGIDRAVNEIVESLLRFLPRLVWALVVLGVGVGVAILVAGRIEDAIGASPAVADRVAAPVGRGARWVLYFFAATIALSELGLHTGVLVVFMDGVAFGLGAALALLVGIGIGWGSKDYVADHVDEWIEAATEGGER